MVNKIKPLCDCGQPIDYDSPEYTTERSERGGERVFRRRPIKCRACRQRETRKLSRAFNRNWDASQRELDNQARRGEEV